MLVQCWASVLCLLGQHYATAVQSQNAVSAYFTGKASRNCLLALQSSRMSRKYILYVYIVYTFPVNTQHLYNICAMSNRRRRRRAGYWVTTYYENRHCP